MYPEENFFEELELLDGILTKKKEKLMTDGIYSYIVHMFSNDPKPENVIECCKATLKLFPYMVTSPSTVEGIVSIFRHIYHT